MEGHRDLGTIRTDDIEVTSSGLDLFTPPPVDVVLQEGKTVQLSPINTSGDNGPFEFIISKDVDHFIYLPMTRLEGCIEVLKEDGSSVKEEDQITVVNLFAQTIFKQVEVEVNGTQVADISSSTYPYKAFIETKLSYGRDAKNSHLQVEGWVDDNLDYINHVDDYASGDAVRHKLIEQKFYFSNVVHVDFFQIERYLLPNIQVKIKFLKNADNFTLFTIVDNCKIKVTDLKLNIRKIRIAPEWHATIERNLAQEPAIYPFTQNKINTFLIPAGYKSFNYQNIVDGNLPKTLIIGFLHTNAYNGDHHVNSFWFNHYGLNYLNLKVNGMPFYPTPLTPDYGNKKYSREFRLLYDNIGTHHSNLCVDVSFAEFEANTNFYAFDFTPDLNNSARLHQTKSGHIDVDLGFGGDLTHGIYMVVYYSMKQVMLIDSTRKVTLLE